MINSDEMMEKEKKDGTILLV